MRPFKPFLQTHGGGVRTVRAMRAVRTVMAGLASLALMQVLAHAEPFGDSPERNAIAPSARASAAQALATQPSVVPPSALEVKGDEVQRPLTDQPGNAADGRQVVIGRDGQCILCHEVPGLRAKMGNVGPSLVTVGARLNPAQIRLRVADSLRINPEISMPSYYRLEGQTQVEPNGRGRTVLSAQQIEDVVAYLSRLR